jgi:hypothetical protein
MFGKIFTLFFLFSLVYSQTCVKTTYGAVGDACDEQDKKCKTFLTCQKGICQPGFIGSTCSGHKDCYLS